MDQKEGEFPDAASDLVSTENAETHEETDTLNSNSVTWLTLLKHQKGAWVLRLTAGSRLQITAAVLGLVLGAGLSVMIFVLTPEQSTAGKLFDLRSMNGALPLVMMVMFFWGLLICFLRTIRFWALRKFSNATVIAESSRMIASVPIDTMLFLINEFPNADGLPLLRRLRIVLLQWQAKPSLQDAVLLLNQQALADTEEIHHSFGVAKTFVWALPVLGLIGTVIGIALAVGDFGQLIGGNVDDISIIKTSLVHVTSGLSFAFTTTLLGLLAALLLVLPSSALQAQEEKYVTNLDAIVVDQLLPQLQIKYPEHTQRGGGPNPDQWREVLSDVARSAVQSAGTAASKVIQVAEERFTAYHQQVVSESHQAAQLLSTATATMGSELTKATDEFLTRVSKLQDIQTEQLSTVRKDVANSLSSSMEIARLLGEAAKEHDRSNAETLSLLEQLKSSFESLLSSTTLLSRSMEELNDGDRTRVIVTYTDTIAKIGNQSETLRLAMEDMAGISRQVVSYQESLEANLRRMEDMALPAALSNLGEMLHTVSVVLKNFQEPIVFQAVRASSLTPQETISSDRSNRRSDASGEATKD